MYTLLDDAHRRQMLERAILDLEAQRFEAEINAAINDGDVVLSGDETATQRIARVDAQLRRLRAAYKDLLKDPA